MPPKPMGGSARVSTTAGWWSHEHLYSKSDVYVISVAFNGEPGVIKTTTIRSALNGGPDEH